MASAGLDRKPTTALTSGDFDHHTVWFVDLPRLDFAEAVEPFENLETDAPYIALTNYILNNGTAERGYCFIYDHTGFTIFSAEGKSIPISDYSECSAEEAQNVAIALGRTVQDIFPIHYRASVKVYGALVEGDITIQLQPNPSINTDAAR